MSKKRNKPGRIVPPPPDQLDGEGIRFQARLHSGKQREREAVEVLQHYLDAGWKERDILREALIALGMMQDQGWEPQPYVDQPTLHAEVVDAVLQMVQLTRELASLDFSATTRHDGGTVDHEQIKQQLTDFDRSAARLVGDVRFFDDEDDE